MILHSNIFYEVIAFYLVKKKCPNNKKKIQSSKTYLNSLISVIIGGFKGGAPGTPPSIFSIFMQFFGNIDQIIGWRPQLWSWRLLIWEILDPPLVMLNTIRRKNLLRQITTRL